ncbi:ScpA family protein [uncultured Megamonas sp.]|jgi:segregation and condensation protein A|uniref:segregation and condensation protein A n=1 Tax=uncultured Megamonas sp. TaxID=286140 RepID=UPI00266F40B2|nr:segregation/condensation protein A [uncultured Megamonas sp.]
MQQEQYKVHLESFEGPLDLLLHLIEKNRIDIYDIPIALLTEQYMEYLAKFKEFNIEIASEFLVMAATLLQIKSKILLPDTKTEEVTEDDTDDIDPRKELVERLLEYRRYKEVSSILGEMADEAGKRFFRDATNLPTKHIPPKGLDISLLYQAFQNVLESQIEHEPIIANVSREQYTIEDKIIELLALLKQHGGNICFNTIFQYSEHKISKSELITTFLAMLELIKIKRINVYQTSIFSPIYLKINDEISENKNDIIVNQNEN